MLVDGEENKVHRSTHTAPRGHYHASLQLEDDATPGDWSLQIEVLTMNGKVAKASDKQAVRVSALPKRSKMHLEIGAPSHVTAAMLEATGLAGTVVATAPSGHGVDGVVVITAVTDTCATAFRLGKCSVARKNEYGQGYDGYDGHDYGGNGEEGEECDCDPEVVVGTATVDVTGGEAAAFAISVFAPNCTLAGTDRHFPRLIPASKESDAELSRTCFGHVSFFAATPLVLKARFTEAFTRLEGEASTSVVAHVHPVTYSMDVWPPRLSDGLPISVKLIATNLDGTPHSTSMPQKVLLQDVQRSQLKLDKNCLARKSPNCSRESC